MPAAQSAVRAPVGWSARVGRWLLAGLAVLCFAIGWAGIFIPGLPTTVFWIVAVLLAGKSCPVVQRWIYSRGRPGALVRSVIETRSLSAGAKRYALVGIWAALGISAVFMLTLMGPVGTWLAIVLPIVGVGVSVYIVRGLKTTPVGI